MFNFVGTASLANQYSFAQSLKQARTRSAQEGSQSARAPEARSARESQRPPTGRETSEVPQREATSNASSKKKMQKKKLPSWLVKGKRLECDPLWGSKGPFAKKETVIHEPKPLVEKKEVHVKKVKRTPKDYIRFEVN